MLLLRQIGEISCINEKILKKEKKINYNILIKVGKVSLITKYDISGKVYLFIYLVLIKTNILLY